MSGGGLHAGMTRVLSFALVVIGIAIVVRTLAAGGGPVAYGVIVGILFAAAGAGRLWISRGGV